MVLLGLFHLHEGAYFGILCKLFIMLLGDSVSTVEYYDVIVARWKLAEPMKTLRSRVGIAVLKSAYRMGLLLDLLGLDLEMRKLYNCATAEKFGKLLSRTSLASSFMRVSASCAFLVSSHVLVFIVTSLWVHCKASWCVRVHFATGWSGDWVGSETFWNSAFYQKTNDSL